MFASLSCYHVMIILFFILVQICSQCCDGAKNSIRDQFTTRFYDRCMKYPFVQKYLHSLDNPHRQYMIFEYQRGQLESGGFGDRLGGVVTAFVHSMRFNRTLYLHAENGLHKLFRPFHPRFIPDPRQSNAILSSDSSPDNFDWQHWPEWSGFNEWKANHSAYIPRSNTYEYLLTDCVDSNPKGFSTKQVHRCALDNVSSAKFDNYPIIRFASNRAYLCHYENHTEFPSHQSVFQTLQLEPNENDLFEVAGCMLRLLLWPTNYLWNKIDQTYQKHYQQLLFESPKDILELIEKEKNSIHSNNQEPEKGADDSETEEEEMTTKKKKKKTKKTKPATKALKSTMKDIEKQTQKNKKKLLKFLPESFFIEQNHSISNPVVINPEMVEMDINGQGDAISTSSVSLETIKESSSSSSSSVAYTLLENPPFQLGLHMRCGDYWSYKELYLHKDGYSRTGCIYDESEELEEGIPYTTDPTTAKRSYYLNTGNPKTLGQCANNLLSQRQNTLNLMKRRQSGRTSRRFDVDANGFFSFPYHNEKNNLNTEQQQEQHSFEGNSNDNQDMISYYVSNQTLVYITSDNYMAELQMKQFTNYYPSMLSPQGCHIDLDNSIECYELTTIYWFLLSLSNLIISQTFSDFNIPTSSFSRYAGIYGLFPDSPFRTGRYCGDKVYSTMEISRKDQGNWYCR